METRVAALEQIAKETRDALAGLRTDIKDGLAGLRTELRAQRTEARTDYRWLLGIMLGGFTALLGVMAHGFRWLLGGTPVLLAGCVYCCRTATPELLMRSDKLVVREIEPVSMAHHDWR